METVTVAQTTSSTLTSDYRTTMASSSKAALTTETHESSSTTALDASPQVDSNALSEGQPVSHFTARRYASAI